MSDFFFNFIGFTLLGAVAIVLIMGIYTLFKGGSTSKKYSNKLMQLRVLLQNYRTKKLKHKWFLKVLEQLQKVT